MEWQCNGNDNDDGNNKGRKRKKSNIFVHLLCARNCVKCFKDLSCTNSPRDFTAFSLLLYMRELNHKKVKWFT